MLGSGDEGEQALGWKRRLVEGEAERSRLEISGSWRSGLCSEASGRCRGRWYIRRKSPSPEGEC